MLAAIFITLIVVAAIGSAVNTERHGGLIGEHRYNNRYSDATGAREDYLG
jgi:hypothetical protein